MMALAAVFPLGIDGHHVHRSQFPVVCQVRGDDDEQDRFLMQMFHHVSTGSLSLYFDLHTLPVVSYNGKKKPTHLC